MPRKGLVIRIDGEVVKKYEERIELVQFMSARGEVSRMSVADSDEVLDLVVTASGNRNRHLLDEIDERREEDRQRAKKREEDQGPEGSASLSGSGNFKEIGVRPDEDIDPRGAKTEDTSSDEDDDGSNGNLNL